MRSLARCGPAVILVLALLIPGACQTVKVPLTDVEVPVPDPLLREWPKLSDIPFVGSGDFRGQSWTDAFDALHLKLSREYPFTEWKGLDWGSLYAKYYPQILLASEENDWDSYYLALRGYLHSIPDGNVSLELSEVHRDRAVGGSYGFSVLPLEDGRVVAWYVAKGGPAARAGLKWGAEILSWNTLPVQRALEQTPTLWADAPPSTAHLRLLEQCRFLTRAPVKSKVVIAFRNLGRETAWVASLTAEADNYAGIQELLREEKGFSDFESPFQWEVLPSGYGYIRIFFEAPTLWTPFPARAFKRVLSRLIEKKVPGLIVDLRSNLGGSDDLAARFASHFFSEPMLYRDAAVYDARTGAFRLSAGDHLAITPREPRFAGPVVVMIHPRTPGAGEGLAMALRRLANVQVLGVFRSAGAFGVPGGEITMPGGYTVFYPTGRPLDAEGRVLLEGNAAGEGGVALDVTVPLTLEALDAYASRKEDVLLSRAVEALDTARAQVPGGGNESPREAR